MAAQFGIEIREREFLFEDGSVFLNQGAFGAVPKIVLDEQIRLRYETEQHPDRWYRRNNPRYYRRSLDAICDIIGTRPEDTVLIENVTTATYSALKSLHLSSSDTILLNSWLHRTVGIMVKDLGQPGHRPKLQTVELKFPAQNKESILAAYEECLDKHPDIKVALLDHITSVSAVLMPVKEISAICRRRGVIVIVDGAQSCGHVPLDIEDLGVDFYGGNVNKWMFTPRGCGYMWIHPDHQQKVRHAIPSHFYGGRLHFDFCIRGTRDDSPYHTIPTAVNFLKSLGGLDAVSAYVRPLLKQGVELLVEGWGTEPLPLGPELQAPFMRVIRVPNTDRYSSDAEGAVKLGRDLMDRFRVVITCKFIQGALYIRVSCHVYCCLDDFIKLRDAVLTLCAEPKPDKHELDNEKPVRLWDLHHLEFK